MSMISTSMSSVNQYSSMQSKLYSKLDSDGDGVLSKEEFVSGRPSDVTEEMAANLYSSIDTEGTGALTEDDFINAFQPEDIVSGIQARASSDITSMMMDQMPPPPPEGEGPPPPPPGDAPDLEEMFSTMDTDGDGVVSEEEFVAARPEDVSEEDSLAFYQSIDTEGTGSITLEQFTAAAPPDAPEGTSAETESASDVAQDLINQLLDVIRSFNEEYVEEDAVAA